MSESVYKELRPVLPWLAALWLGHALIGGLSASPFIDASSVASDVDLFEPGGMMIGDLVRVRRFPLRRAMKGGIALLLFGQALLVLLRARMTWSVGEVRLGNMRRGGIRAAFPRYMLAVGLQLVALGAAGSVALVVARRLYEWQQGALHPGKLSVFLGWGLLCVVGYCAISAMADLVKLGALRGGEEPAAPPTLSRLFLWMLQTMRRFVGPLLLLRGARFLVTGLLTVAIPYAITSTPLGPFGAMMSGVLVQLCVLLALAVETLWLAYSAGRLSDATR